MVKLQLETPSSQVMHWQVMMLVRMLTFVSIFFLKKRHKRHIDWCCVGVDVWIIVVVQIVVVGRRQKSVDGVSKVPLISSQFRALTVLVFTLWLSSGVKNVKIFHAIVSIFRPKIGLRFKLKIDTIIKHIDALIPSKKSMH